jgi:hypothetical protein
MARQQREQNVQGVREPGRIRYMIWADAVELDVERVKPGAGIDQHGEGLDLIVGLDASQADLADAGDITASRFDIQRNEAKTAFRHPVGMGKSWSVLGALGLGFAVLGRGKWGLALL